MQAESLDFSPELLLDFEWYSPKFLFISSKTLGIIPFNLRRIQRKYLHHLKEDFPGGIVRSISLKPRQAGWSTLISGINSHYYFNWWNEKGILIADKKGRTKEVFSIYENFKRCADPKLLPVWTTDNKEEIFSEFRNSGFRAETAQDPNAGRSGTRKWAHLTEYAFYPYAKSIDEGVQNSIPLAPGTRIFKESTAYGMAGIGEDFYQQWEAATRGDSIYKPFFVAWYEVDDYAMEVPIGFRLTKTEKELISLCPEITRANLMWRRLKLKEYSADPNSIFSPEERMAQDFPSYPEEAFLSTGRPVFDQKKIKTHILKLQDSPPPTPKIAIKKYHLSMFPEMLRVFEIPKKGMNYTIGADVAEGVEGGDFSSAVILDQNQKTVARFHGHIDADIFGRVLVELAKIYNEALIVPEINNMGHTTLNAIKDMRYFKIYSQEVFDELGQKDTPKLGWRTTKKSKQTMLNKLVASYRDNHVGILDELILKEMLSCTRESDGNVILTGKDRVVALCLALMGMDQIYEPAIVINPGKKKKVHFENKDISRELAAKEPEE